MGIKLAIFDGEGVLYSYNKAMRVFFKEYEKFLRKFGASFRKQGRMFEEVRPMIVRGRITLKEANKTIFRKLGIPVCMVDEWLKKDLEISLKYVKLKDYVKQTLLALKKRGIKVAILDRKSTRLNSSHRT